MEVFKVFATISLKDLLSGPLARIRAGLKDTDGATLSLGQRMGKLALAMAPVAIAAGALLGVFGASVAKAMDFESAMADVAKVVDFDSPEEFKAMSDTVKELAGRLPMAQEGIAAIIEAAGQTGIAKEDLADFAEQAAKMGVAFDLTGDQAGGIMADWRNNMGLTLTETYALADAVNHLSNNMNATAPALAEVVRRTGGLAMGCGLAETEVAALGTAFLSTGAAPEVASTALNKFIGVLVRGEGLSKRGAKAFESLGFSATQLAKDMQVDAKGTIFKVLESLANKPKEMQISMLTQMFGEEAVGAIAPLLKNMDNLSKAFELVGDKSNYAGSMEKEFETRSKTTKNALQLLSNKIGNLSISLGTIFLPAVSWGAEKLGQLTDAVRELVDSPLGQWLVKAAAVLSGVLIGITALAAGVWGLSWAGGALMKILLPLKAAILGLGWPILALIAAAGLLYAAWKNNFGGIADTISRWGKNISLVINGVIAVFNTLNGTTGEIRGELARDIKAAGLEKLVVSISKIIYRIKSFFKGIWDGLNFSGVLKILEPVGEKIKNLFGRLSEVFSKLFGGEVESAADSFASFGQKVGAALTWLMEGGAKGFVLLLDAAEWVFDKLGAYWSILWSVAKWVIDKLGAYWSGLWSGLDFSGVLKILEPLWGKIKAIFGRIGQVIERIGQVIERIGKTFSKIFGGGGEVDGSCSTAKAFLTQFGEIVGKVLTWGFKAAATSINVLVNAISIVIDWFDVLTSLLTGDFDAAWEGLKRIWDSLADSFMSVADFFGVGDWLRDFWKSLEEFSLGEWLAGIWQSIKDFFGSIDLLDSGVKLLNSLVEGFKSAVDAVLNFFSETWQKIKDFFGGVSLFEVGAACIGGLKDGIMSILGGIGGWFSGAWESVTGFFGSISLGETGARCANSLKDGISSVIGGIGGWFSSAWESVTGFFGSVSLTEAGVGCANGLKDGIMSVIDGAGDWFSGAWESMSGFFSSVSEGIKSKFSGVYESVSGVLENLGSKVGSWWDKLFGGEEAAKVENPAAVLENADMTGFADNLRNGMTENLDITQWLNAPCQEALNFLGSINLFESGARLLDTLKEGILSKAAELKAQVTGVFSSIRNLLPFSDAKEGPFSQLTLSGSKIMTTLASGVLAGAPELQKSLSGALEKAGSGLEDYLHGPQITADIPEIPEFKMPNIPEIEPIGEYKHKDSPDSPTSDKDRSIRISIGNITLPKVQDPEDFVQSLQKLVKEFGGAPA